MSLTAISSPESARRKFFMNSTQNMCNHLESHVFGLRRPKMSLTANSLFQSDRRKFFMNSLQNMCKNLESNVFGLRRPK